MDGRQRCTWSLVPSPLALVVAVAGIGHDLFGKVLAEAVEMIYAGCREQGDVIFRSPTELYSPCLGLFSQGQAVLTLRVGRTGWEIHPQDAFPCVPVAVYRHEALCISLLQLHKIIPCCLVRKVEVPEQCLSAGSPCHVELSSVLEINYMDLSGSTWAILQIPSRKGLLRNVKLQRHERASGESKKWGGNYLATSANYVRICSSSRLQLVACSAGSIPTWACGLDHHVMSAVSFPRKWGE